MVGRFFWASTSDYIGRRNTYFVFFALGILLYSTVPSIGYAGSIPLFVAAFVIILSMYGGGFATIPAYLRDVFGTMHVGAIHGRLLTAWSAAGVLGPVLDQLHPGVPDRARRTQGSGLFGHHVHHVRPALDRAHL